MVSEGFAKGYTMLSLPLNGFAGKIGSKSLDVEEHNFRDSDEN